MMRRLSSFFFNDTATTEIYTLSLHDALPISGGLGGHPDQGRGDDARRAGGGEGDERDPAGGGLTLGARIQDRKSTRLNSSHANISYAVFCLKKKRKIESEKADMLVVEMGRHA